jgi:hypothetical protein
VAVHRGRLSLVLFVLSHYYGTRSYKIVIGIIISFFFVGYMGMWGDMMESMGFIIVATIMAISFWHSPWRLDGKIQSGASSDHSYTGFYANPAAFRLFNSGCDALRHWKNSWIDICHCLCATSNDPFNKLRN